MTRRIIEIDGEERRRRELADGEMLRVPLLALDGSTKEVVIDHGLGGPGRPGPRMVVDEGARERVSSAYAEHDKMLRDSWLSPEQRARATEDAAAPPLHDDPQEDAYRARDAWLRDAWRTP
jgi:hypothetical protein